MEKIWRTGLLFLSYVFLVGMGNIGGSSQIAVPEPVGNYSATVVDQSDLSVRVEKFSFEGNAAISGKLGNSRVSIDFDKIASIDFILQDKTLKAEVLLKGGKSVPILVEKGTACYGKLPYGDFKILTEDIRSITIHGLADGH